LWSDDFVGRAVAVNESLKVEGVGTKEPTSEQPSVIIPIKQMTRLNFVEEGMKGRK
jgi:hypothetical protein